MSTTKIVTMVATLVALCVTSCAGPASVRVTRLFDETGRLEVPWIHFAPPPGRPPVVLVSTVHVAEPRFFSAVQETLDQTPVVLMEGIVRDGEDRRIAPGLFDVAAALRLVHQVETLVSRLHWRKADLGATEYRRLILPAIGGPSLRDFQKDVNYAIFSYRRRHPDVDPAEAAEAARRGPARGLYADRVRVLVARDRVPTRVREARHRVALAALDRCKPGAAVALCWGFAHVAAFREELEERGYTVECVTWHTAFEW